MKCLDCKFASWPNRTATGRISKKSPGQCTWEKTVPVASSYFRSLEHDSVVILEGGTIWHDDDMQCHVAVLL